MNRSYYLDLAASGLRMPIGTDLVLREKPDHADIQVDGERLGQVVIEAAKRYNTPLAIPLMDLTIEKETMLSILGIPATEIGAYHFHGAPSPETLEQVNAGLSGPPTARSKASVDAIRHVAKTSSLLPCGMSIGPFSFMTKMLADPVAGIYMAGLGETGEPADEALAVERALDLSVAVIIESLKRQIDAGAKLIVLCEPAANRVYISPRQLAKGSDVFERLVMKPNLRIKALLDDAGVDLLFHDCGELTGAMVEKFADLRPVMMSLGCSRTLWEDASLLPKDIVLYGNLPTKRFYSDDLTVPVVQEMARELLAKMKATEHPYVLGSECDVLSVPEKHAAITEKVCAFLSVEPCPSRAATLAQREAARHHPRLTPGFLTT